MKFPVAGKAMALAAVMLTLIVALNLVSDLVTERQHRLREAQQGIADSLAGNQVLVGPVLQRQCTESWKEQQGEGKEKSWVERQRDFMLHALPQRLAADGSTQVEPRYRGIFRINGYVLKATVNARWTGLETLQPPLPKAGVQQTCTDPILWIGVADPRGLRSAVATLDGQPATVQPGTPAPQIPRGFQVGWPTGKPVNANSALSVQIAVELVGTEDLAFVPLGEQTVFKLASDWPHPSFNGRFLPTERKVSDTGFQAEWSLSSLASRSGQQIIEGHGLCVGNDPVSVLPNAAPAAAQCLERFGVAFIDPVSVYVLSDRATKYGLLFVILTFVAVGLVEVMKSLRVHPIQYALVGAALALFFLLLVSLGEHVRFGIAYASAATACTLLLGYYGAHVLQGWRAGAVFAAGIAGLYGLLYLLLLAEQSSLVLGSAMLFIVLAAIMVVTRRIDWYALTERLRGKGVTPSARAA